MRFDPEKHHRRSIRLGGYDYSQAGAYFVTICTQDRQSLFGEIVEGEMRLNEYGWVVAECWEWLDQRYQHVDLDGWVVMPNHLHGVIMIDDVGRGGSGRGGSRTAPTDMAKRKPLGRLIGAFKTVSAKQINNLRGMSGAPVGQRNYYEHVIRAEDELDRIRGYIDDNPRMWEMDRENPTAQKTRGKESWLV